MVIQCLKMVIARSCYGLLSKIISSFTALIIFQSLLFSMQLKTEVTDGMTHNELLYCMPHGSTDPTTSDFVSTFFSNCILDHHILTQL